MKPDTARFNTKRRMVSPFSRRLSLAVIDGRTREGRVALDTRGALFEQLGPQPTAAQQVMVNLVTVKILRCEQLAQRVLSGDPSADRCENIFQSWTNGIRADLTALGLLDTKPSKSMDKSPWFR